MSDSTPKKVLITGCTGQDGSYMADYLIANTPHQIYGMVRRTAKPDYSNLKNALTHPDRFRLVTGDLSDATSLDTLVKDIQPDYFINLAAQSFVGASWHVPEQTFDVTATGVLRCLEAIRKHALKCRFYSAGSSEQWGDVVYSPQDEKHPLRPRSPYGAAKCAAAHIVKVYRESYGLYAVHGILFNHESERRGEEFVTRKITKGVARIAAAIKAGQPFEPIELGNLDAKRDWSHAEDFVDGIWRMLNQDVYRSVPPIGAGVHMLGGSISLTVQNPQEYVLASGETHSVREFVTKAFRAADISGLWIPSPDSDPAKEVYRLAVPFADSTSNVVSSRADDPVLVLINPAFYRPAEVDLLWGDATRARTELGWSPKVSFDELVRRMVEADMAAYQNQPATRLAA